MSHMFSSVPDLPQWHAAYLCVRHEKKVAQQLGQKQIEHFLPLFTKTYRSKQRSWSADLPLFPGYIFVRISLQEQMKVLGIPSVVHLLSTGGKPIVLPDEEIAALRGALNSRRSEPHPNIAIGSEVQIAEGPLRGLKGRVLRRGNGLRIVVSVDWIAQSVALELEESDLLVAPLAA